MAMNSTKGAGRHHREESSVPRYTRQRKLPKAEVIERRDHTPDLMILSLRLKIPYGWL